MEITKLSPYTGKENTMNLPITPEQYKEWMDGGLIQEVMPNLNADQREFLMTGYTPQDWEAIFGTEDTC